MECRTRKSGSYVKRLPDQNRRDIEMTSSPKHRFREMTSTTKQKLHEKTYRTKH
ncbi:hypothetical protein CHS0354_006359, partial [Potamilus streckersoni]